MKKYLPILTVIMSLLVFVACVRDVKEIDNTNDGTIDNTIVGNASDDNTDVQAGGDKSQDQNQAKTVFEILGVRKGIAESFEWYEDTPEMLARCRTSYITLDESEREKYPNLAKVLDETAALCKGSQITDFENLVYLANREIELYDGFVTQKSFLDMHIRRSDSTAFSVISDSYMDTMYIKDFRAFHGTSYDTETGKELKITDVVTDMSAFSQIVENELDRHMWSGEYLCETAVKEYFENRTPDGISWVLDYNGVTVYFNPGDIAEQGFGRAAATVSFKEHPELFAEKYMKVPESYIVKIPTASSNYLDLNNDGFIEEFIVASQFDEDMGMYSAVYIVTNEDLYEESICAYGFNPYYIKTADGRHLLYLFVEGSDSWHRLMNLYVYDVTGEKVTKLDEIAYAPHHSVDEDGTDVFSLPTDPEKMYLDYFVNDDGFFYPSFAEDCKVGSDGLPESVGDGIMMDYPSDEQAKIDEDTPYIDFDYRTEYANALEFDLADGMPYFAVAFIGYGEDLADERNDYIERVFFTLDKSLIDKIEHFDFDGDEWYLIVPRYKDYVDIKSLDSKETRTVYQGEAFTVRCNVSDIYSNIEISTDIRGGHTFSPQMGGNGMLAVTDDVMDITYYG